MSPPPTDTAASASIVQIDSLSESQIQQFCELLENQWGLKGGSFDDLRLAVENASLIVALAESQSGRLVAGCRVLTDFIFQATIHGVIVAEDWRGRGLGRRLMDAVVRHPRLRRVRCVWLRCFPEMEAFYANWDFGVPDDGVNWLKKQAQDPSG